MWWFDGSQSTRVLESVKAVENAVGSITKWWREFKWQYAKVRPLINIDDPNDGLSKQ